MRRSFKCIKDKIQKQVARRKERLDEIAAEPKQKHLQEIFFHGDVSKEEVCNGGGIVHFPNEKIICEIPIYSMSKKEFERRWDKWKDNWYERSEQMGHSAEETEEVVNSIMVTQYPRNVWKYNQIVGFVEIAINSYAEIHIII